MSTNIAERRSVNGGSVARGFIFLLGSGILWGWLWFTLVHVIPYFYVIAPAVDIAAYGLVGTGVNRAIRRYTLTNRWRLTLAILAMVVFYIGNRLISLTWIIGTSSFTKDGQSLARMLFESLIILVGLITATGLWKPGSSPPSDTADAGVKS